MKYCAVAAQQLVQPRHDHQAEQARQPQRPRQHARPPARPGQSGGRGHHHGARGMQLPFGTATLDGVDHPPLWPASVPVTLRTMDQPKPPGLCETGCYVSTACALTCQPPLEASRRRFICAATSRARSGVKVGGRLRSTSGSRRAGTTVTPIEVTCPPGTIPPNTATIGTTAMSGAPMRSWSRSAFDLVALKLGSRKVRPVPQQPVPRLAQPAAVVPDVDGEDPWRADHHVV